MRLRFCVHFDYMLELIFIFWGFIIRVFDDFLFFVFEAMVIDKWLVCARFFKIETIDGYPFVIALSVPDTTDNHTLLIMITFWNRLRTESP